MNAPNKHCEETMDLEEFLNNLEDDLLPDEPDPIKGKDSAQIEDEYNRKVTIEYFGTFQAQVVRLRYQLHRKERVVDKQVIED